MKIYISNNYLFIDNGTQLFEGLSKDVLVRRYSNSSETFYFKNVNGFKDSIGVELADIQKENGSAYTLSEFVEFYTLELGKSSASNIEAYVAGWEVSFDGLITNPTISVTTTPTLVTIDGVGSESNDSYLPKEILGIGNLWDSTNNIITPISIGDSYDLRLQIGLSSLTNTPTELIFQLDIGGQSTPTIVVATDTKPIKKLTQPIVYSFPIFSLSTFLTNGGQIFLSTDKGTAVIDDRSILIVRESSGTI